MTWAWKNERPEQHAGLLYDPGNWGDVLKGAWVLELADDLSGQGEARLLDVCAGQPHWPLGDAAAARLEALVDEDLRRAQAPHVEQGRLASTGLLALEALGPRARATVTDADARRREAWSALPCVTVLDHGDGAQALRDHGADADLVLVDPFDLIGEPGDLLAASLATPDHSWVLMYLFNRAPRGAQAFHRYRALRRAIDEGRGARRVLVGRLPSDAVLPRAYHEVLLLAPPDASDDLPARLGSATRRLARGLADAGAFEGD